MTEYDDERDNLRALTESDLETAAQADKPYQKKLEDIAQFVLYYLPYMSDKDTGLVMSDMLKIANANDKKQLDKAISEAADNMDEYAAFTIDRMQSKTRLDCLESSIAASILVARSQALKTTASAFKSNAVKGSGGSAGDKAVNRVIDGAVGAVPFSQRLWQADTTFTSEINNSIRNALMNGVDVSKINDSLFNFAKPVAGSPTSRASVHEFNVRRLIVSENSRIYNDARLERIKLAGGKYFKVVAEPGVCKDICVPKLNKVFKIGSDPTPPFHPFCRCSIIMVDKDGNELPLEDQ